MLKTHGKVFSQFVPKLVLHLVRCHSVLIASDCVDMVIAGADNRGDIGGPGVTEVKHKVDVLHVPVVKVKPRHEFIILIVGHQHAQIGQNLHHTERNKMENEEVFFVLLVVGHQQGGREGVRQRERETEADSGRSSHTTNNV